MSLRSFYFYNQQLRQALHSDLHLFELSVWIQAFAQSLFSVFIPIILWRLGFTIQNILGFYFIFNLLDVPLNLVARHLIVRFGARTVLIISICANLVYLITLFNLSNSWTQILILAAALAIFDSFYWVSHIYIFVRSAHASEKMRHDVGTLNIVRDIGGLLAPALGALVLIVSSPRTLIFFSTILMFSSLIPLSRMRHLVFKPEEKVKSFREFFRQPVEKINYFLEALGAIHVEIEDVIWPFFVFLLFKSVQPVALIAVTISFAGLVVTYLTSKYSVRQNIYRLVSYGGLALAFLWTMRAISPNSTTVLYVTVFLIALTGILVDIPMDVAIFERSRHTDMLSTATYRNLFRMGARALFYLWLLFAPGLLFRNSLGIVITTMLVLFAFSMIVSLRVDRRSLMEPPPTEMEDIERVA